MVDAAVYLLFPRVSPTTGYTDRAPHRRSPVVDGLAEIMVAPQNKEGSPGPSVEEVIRVFAEDVTHRL